MPEEPLSRLGLLQAFDGVGQDEEAVCCEASKKRGGNVRRYSAAILAMAMVVAITVAVTLAAVRHAAISPGAADLASDDVTVGNKTYDLSKTSDRAELVDLIKSASHQSPDPATTQGDAAVRILVDQFKVSTSDPTKYATGARRRPTDPATPEEIAAALKLLFGETGKISSLEQADALSSNSLGWAAINAQLAPEFRVYPEYIRQANRISHTCTTTSNKFGTWEPYAGGEGTSGYPKPCSAQQEAQKAFMAEVDRRGGNVTEAHKWLRSQPNVRAALTWAGVSSTTTFVDKAIAVAVDEDLDAGREPNRTIFAKLVALRVRGGTTETKPNGDVYGADVYIVVDVTDPRKPFSRPEYTDAYSSYQGNIHITPRARISDVDLSYLLAAAHGLYGQNEFGNARVYNTFCQCDPSNLMAPGMDCGVNGGWNSLDIRYFVKPFVWLDGIDKARKYGAERQERILSVQTGELSPSVVPMDGHQVTTGTFLYGTPLTMLRTVNEVGNASAPRVDPHNTLIGSEAIALAFYGRGLNFISSETQDFLAAVKAGADRNQSEVVRKILTAAIHRAWGNDAVHGVQPGVLTTRASDGASVLAIVEQHPYRDTSYANHATPSVVADALASEELAKIRAGHAPHRDVRDNPAWMRPPTDPVTGLPRLAPQGKRLETIAVAGPSFATDGYGVVWDVGLKWRFSVGFAVDAGVTLYNVRVVLPPTEAYPDGQIVPYLYKVNIPHYGTAYATASLGNLFSATFLESHFDSGIGLVPGQNCRGPSLTLPIFRAKGMTDVQSFLQKPIFYSTYGVDGVTDPYASEFLGINDLPFQAFALDGRFVDQGVIADMICLAESDDGHSMWHLYTAQRLRKLTVSQATVSDAYNVVINFEMFSNGKMKVAERLHGKPAIVNFGLPGIGGAYANAGKGGYASNHIHWHAISLEPHVKKNLPGVRNALFTHDLAMATDDTNWYGMAFHRVGQQVRWSNDSSLLKFDYAKNRFWRLAAIDAAGNDLGGLSIRSAAWGPAPVTDFRKPPMRYASDTNFTAEETFANHWWLNQQDVFVQNANNTRDRQVLISSGRNGTCRVGLVHRCLPDELIGNSPSVHVVMKMYHGVITDELPVQNGFTNVETEISPHNLFGYNPNLMVRYMPGYAKSMQNNYFYTGPQIYTPPYDSEWQDL